MLLLKMASTEKDTQRAILMYLAAKRYFCWRQNSGTFKNERGGFYWMGTAGAPDIFVVHSGCIYGVEVKDIKGKLNDNQISFKEKFEAAGGIFITARSLDDVMTVLK